MAGKLEGIGPSVALVPINALVSSERSLFTGWPETGFSEVGMPPTLTPQSPCQRRFAPTAVHLRSGTPFGFLPESMFTFTGIPRRAAVATAKPGDAHNQQLIFKQTP
jgi:hypothetical protein